MNFAFSTYTRNDGISSLWCAGKRTRGGDQKERRHLIAQNSRFLVLPATGRWPNLASRVLKLACARLPEDWQQAFGHPVRLAETFVDPQRFRGTCYRAANWQRLGRTRGFARRAQDYYLDTRHPKELWVYPLGRGALRDLRAAELAAELRAGTAPLPPPVPVPTEQLSSLAGLSASARSSGPVRRALRADVFPGAGLDRF